MEKPTHHKNLGIIPARMGSTRFPGKPLTLIAGKPMIQRVYERTLLSKKIDKVIIATDSEEILKVSEGFGAQAVMTSNNHATGLDRIMEASAMFAEYNRIVNIQGDEPVIDPATIDGVLSLFDVNPKCEISTAAIAFKTMDDFQDVNQVKVVFNDSHKALYFSRSPIAYQGSQNLKRAYKHLGIYAYTSDVLQKIKKLTTCELEEMEKLEQLRFLNNDIDVYVHIARSESIGVDVPEDVQKVEQYIMERGEQIEY